MIQAARAEGLSGWGRYPVARCLALEPSSPADATSAMSVLATSIARGNARSYGDSSLNPEGVILTRRLDHLLGFDDTAGVLTCETGVLLSDIVDVFLPRGWFPAVTPGTRFVTVGGMIASDVHGKNHHGSGSFADHLLWIDLALPDGRIVRCSPTEEFDLFAATCGGMGLTGVILRASFRLLAVATTRIRQRTVQASCLREVFAAFEAGQSATYSVAWVDTLATGDDLGRSALYFGEHARLDELPPVDRAKPLARKAAASKQIPVEFPEFALSRPSVWLFNQVYYRAQTMGERLCDIERYFYPLDAVLDWNRIYGRRGFVQFQCVLPLSESLQGMERLLLEVSSRGSASFLTVLKRMGPSSFGYLSFPMEGYTLAMDFPANAANFALIDRLDAITGECGGRVYLAKDARTSAESVAHGYPRLNEFRQLRARWGLDEKIQSTQSRRLGL